MGSKCPECGASWDGDHTCQDDFYQMLFWEAEDPRRGEVHHLTVLCYHLQHPSRYSPDGLVYAQQLLVNFVQEGAAPQEVRKQKRDQVDSGRRSWKVTSRSGARGVYTHPVRWTMTAADVVAAGAEAYCESVRAWAQSILVALRELGNSQPE